MGTLSHISPKFTSLTPYTHLKISAIISGLIYLLVFTVPFPLTTFYDTIPPVDYTKLTDYSRTGFLAYIFGIGALYGFYFWAIRLASPVYTQPRRLSLNRQSTSVRRFVLLTGVLFALILLFAYPLTAIDLFIYAIRTRGWALYNLPPLSTPPETLPPSDPWLGLAGEWVDAASPYGPLWEWLSLGAFYLGNGDFLSHLLALKLLGMAAYLGCIWLIYQMLQAHRPRWTLAGIIAFAWNPLVLFEGVQNAHNDIVMVFFLLAAIWLFAGTRRDEPAKIQPILTNLLICLSLALSILVKFVTILVIPFFLLALAMDRSNWPRRIANLALYSLAMIVLVVLPMLPVWPGWDNWAVVKAGSGAGRSLLALLVLGLRDTLGTNTAFDLFRNLILIIYALIYFYHLWQLFAHFRHSTPSNPSPNLFILPTFQILFWYVLIAVPVFHAWYILWFLPLGLLLLPQQRPLMAAIVFSLSALLIIPYFETLRIWYPILLQNHFLGHLIGVPLLLLPPALTLLWSTGSTTDSEVSSVKRET